jgi:uncharacterized protein (TIGR03067 family)
MIRLSSLVVSSLCWAFLLGCGENGKPASNITVDTSDPAIKVDTAKPIAKDDLLAAKPKLADLDKTITAKTTERAHLKAETEALRKQELDRLQGTWVLVYVEGDGMVGVPFLEKGMQLRFIDEKAIWINNGEENDEGTPFKLDPTQKPKALDFSEGMNCCRMIYDLEDDNLRIACFLGFPFGAPPDERPATFDHKKNERPVQLVVLEMRKQKK